LSWTYIYLFQKRKTHALVFEFLILLADCGQVQPDVTDARWVSL